MTEAEAIGAFEGILDRLGVRAGDRLMVGIDMGNLPLPAYRADLSRDAFREREKKWCRFVLDRLRARLGPWGTLIVPTFTYSCGKPGSVFIAESTPSEIGPFTEFVRGESGSVRSLHPIFSLAATGGDAELILGGVGRAAFGAKSPFGRFAEHGVRFLCLGVELRNAITYVHHLEQCYGCPHRYTKSFDVEVRRGGKTVPGPWYAYVAYRGIGHESDILSLQRGLKDAGELAEADWEGRPNHLAGIEAVDRVGYDLLATNSSAFVDRNLSYRFDDSTTAGTDVGVVTVTAVENRQ